MRIECKNPEAVAKRAFWLAWKACGGPIGMGVFQDNPEATEEDVWSNVNRAGDYPHRNKKPEPNKMSGDYVFGRMMKLGLEWDDESVTVTDMVPRRDYQSWSRKYPTYESLIKAAIDSL